MRVYIVLLLVAAAVWLYASTEGELSVYRRHVQRLNAEHHRLQESHPARRGLEVA